MWSLFSRTQCKNKEIN